MLFYDIKKIEELLNLDCYSRYELEFLSGQASNILDIDCNEKSDNEIKHLLTEKLNKLLNSTPTAKDILSLLKDCRINL